MIGLSICHPRWVPAQRTTFGIFHWQMAMPGNESSGSISYINRVTMSVGSPPILVVTSWGFPQNWHPKSHGLS